MQRVVPSRWTRQQCRHRRQRQVLLRAGSTRRRLAASRAASSRRGRARVDGANVTGSISRRSLESWADATHLSPHDIGEKALKVGSPCPELKASKGEVPEHVVRHSRHVAPGDWVRKLMITRRNLVKRFGKYRLQCCWNAVRKAQGACRVGGHSRDEAQPKRGSSNGVANPNVWPCVDDDDTPRRAVVRGRSAPARQIARGRSRHRAPRKSVILGCERPRAVSQPCSPRTRRHLPVISAILRRPTAPEVPLSDARAD